jgi:membrane protease YdiL (CAAX protease family)
MTLGVAGVLAGGASASGPISRGWRTDPPHRPVSEPVLIGAVAFGTFYATARAVRHVPPLRRALSSVLQYAHEGSDGLVLLTALANGAAEELFFRGALYDAVGPSHPVTKSTAIYVLATTPTRNPALILASGVMGTLFAVQRRQTGGIQAPLLTHLTWSTLMLRYLPPLFAPEV